MTDIIEIRTTIRWETYKDARSGQWIGVCESLRLTALGETQSDLLDAIADAQNALFRDLLVDEELDAYLRARGWAMSGKLPEDPTSDGYRFDAPIEVLVSPRSHGQTPPLHQ